MAIPQEKPPQETMPRTVVGAKSVNLVLVSYVDDTGQAVTQLAIAGDNTVQLLESRALGISKTSTPVGTASDWLKKGVFEKLGRSNGPK